MNNCHKTEYNGETWKDIIEFAIDLQTDLDKCNQDKEALRKWKTDNINLKEDNKK